MDAVVLAAGMGRRMGARSDVLPKCLTQVGGQPLLVHSLRKLISVGFSPIVVVTGHLSPMVEAAVKPLQETADIVLVKNPCYYGTGTATSLCCSEPMLTPGRTQFLLVEGDLLYDIAFLKEAKQRSVGTIFTADVSGSGDEVYVLTTLLGRLREVAKSISSDCKREIDAGMIQIAGELAGISVLPRSFIRYLQARQYDSRGFDVRDYESFVCEFDTAVPLTVRWLRNHAWAEVDTIDDLKRAQEVVWPRICAA